MIPVVGAGLLWAPIALYFLVTGAIWKGVVLVVFGAVVLTAVDTSYGRSSWATKRTCPATSFSSLRSAGSPTSVQTG